MIFYLGSHEPLWLKTAGVPLMVSRVRLARLGKKNQATVDWVLDSGGFTELSIHGAWRIDAKTYADEVRRYSEAVGRLVWAAPQDWMCEPFVVAKTGLTVGEHLARTVGNYLELKALGAPVIPVLQGFTLADYLDCAERYAAAGVDLAVEETVGLGSVCRRQNTDEIGEIVTTFHGQGLRLHGFGCKTGAIRRYGSLLHSADSMAWSKDGLHQGTCRHLASRCANHLHWALSWREKVVAITPGAATCEKAAS